MKCDQGLVSIPEGFLLNFAVRFQVQILAASDLQAAVLQILSRPEALLRTYPEVLAEFYL